MNSYLRAGSRLVRQVSIDSEDWSVTDVDPVEDSERKALVRRALSLLDSRDRRILLLTLVNGLKAGEIAARIGVTSEVVRARKSRALKKMIERVSALSQGSRPTTGQPNTSLPRAQRPFSRNRDYSPESLGALAACKRRKYCVLAPVVTFAAPSPLYVCVSIQQLDGFRLRLGGHHERNNRGHCSVREDGCRSYE